MLNFITKFFKPLSIIIYAIIISITYVIGIESHIVKTYLSGLAQGLPLLLLIWIYKFEEDYNKKIDEKLNNLKKEIDKNEDLLRELWNGFSHVLTDSQFDVHLRTLIASYPSLELDNFAVRNNVIDSIIKTKNIIITREFAINFGAIIDYPEPYYQVCDGEIIATNIGTASQGFWGKIIKSNGRNNGINQLLQLNREAIENNRNINDKFTIRRLFILDSTDISEDVYELMNSFLDIGVKVNYISRKTAEQIAVDNGNAKITKLEDFTVFILKKSNICFSGRLEDIRETKKIIISTHTDVIDGLRKQFSALWKISNEYIKNSEIILD